MPLSLVVYVKVPMKLHLICLDFIRQSLGGLINLNKIITLQASPQLFQKF